MEYRDFNRILDAHVERYGVPEIVSLQGEGEPTLHKHFFKMAAKVRELGSVPTTITNGTYNHPEHFLENFESVGVSVDTLNELTAKRIGRYNLPKVISFIETLSKDIRVWVITVAFTKEVPAVRRFCQERGLHHVVQPLQSKPDYAYRYPNLQRSSRVRKGGFWCRYIAYPLPRHYAMDATELPCCYIKDLTLYNGIKEMAAQAAKGTTPNVCKGCLFGQRLMNRWGPDPDPGRNDGVVSIVVGLFAQKKRQSHIWLCLRCLMTQVF